MVAVIVISDLEFGGAQRQVVELANHMDPAKCRMHVCSLSDFVPLADSLRDRAGRLHLVLRRFRLDFTVVPRLASLLRQVKADVVHSYLFDATIAARLAGRMGGCRAIIGSERNTDYEFKRTDLLALKWTESLSHLTIANSSAGAAFNGRVFKQPKSHYRVVHNGVNTDRFTPRPMAAMRQELGLPVGPPIVGMFASFKPQKNHTFWLHAARQVVARVPDVKLLFVGDELYKGMSDSTTFKKTINQMVDDFGLRPNCIFVGNRPDVEKYYNACTVTVLPSLFEGTPNVALESMASGIPIVATNVADNSYIVPDSRAGYIIELDDEANLADRITRLLQNVAHRETMSHAARAWVLSEFSGARLAEKTLAAYHDALNSK